MEHRGQQAVTRRKDAQKQIKLGESHRPLAAQQNGNSNGQRQAARNTTKDTGALLRNDVMRNPDQRTETHQRECTGDENLNPVSD